MNEAWDEETEEVREVVDVVPAVTIAYFLDATDEASYTNRQLEELNIDEDKLTK